MKAGHRKHWRRALWTLAVLVLAPSLFLVLAAALEPLPEPLRTEDQAPSLRVLDRHGELVRVVRAGDGALETRVPLKDVSPDLVAALLAAEDARFRWHPGIDPLAMLRAASQAVVHRRVVSGASTITQQLARNVFDRPDSARGKLRELAVALRIEAELDKDRILEEYLNRVEFGPNVRGVQAASRLYFDKPVAKLSLAEAATLAAIPRGPTLYDPRRGTERVRRRRDRILARMGDGGFASAEAVERAQALPVRLHDAAARGGALHLVSALSRGRLGALPAGATEVQISIDVDLQEEVERLVATTAQRMVSHDASASAAVVVQNDSGEVLAYVGSPDFFDEIALGQNDGARAARQPGSTLKPFVYAEAIEQLQLTPASLLPDVELHLPTPAGDYSPNNYDGRFHGPVRLREALASSLNVPAVYLAHRVGPDRVLHALERVGFESLDEDPQHYGAAIALGDGEVSLLELAEAYSTLARGGVRKPLRFVRQVALGSGTKHRTPVARGRRVLRAPTAALITHILSDEHARASAFGRGNPLELPFPVAAKTGTSKGYRDNWTVGFTNEVTVAVWVGNFDGRPMTESSGITGAAPLFAEVMQAAMRQRDAKPLTELGDFVQVEVCSLSGRRPGSDCPHRVRELFAPEQLPREVCAMHERVEINPGDGLRAGPACRHAESRVFERYPAAFVDWARAAQRPIAPEAFSPACPGDASASTEAPSVAYPYDGARFVIDPAVAREQQELELRARVPSDSRGAHFVLDGRTLAHVSEPPYRVRWRLEPGDHVFHVATARGRTEQVRFSVR